MHVKDIYDFSAESALKDNLLPKLMEFSKELGRQRVSISFSDLSGNEVKNSGMERDTPKQEIKTKSPQKPRTL